MMSRSQVIPLRTSITGNEDGPNYVFEDLRDNK